MKSYELTTTDIILFGKRVRLSERPASVSLAWSEEVNRGQLNGQQEDTVFSLNSLNLLVVMVAEALRCNLRPIPGMRETGEGIEYDGWLHRLFGWRKSRNDRFRPEYIVEHLTLVQIQDLCTEVARLEGWELNFNEQPEGSKKKMVEARPLAASSAGP